jgi:iron complex outermembrane recepter protein
MDFINIELSVRKCLCAILLLFIFSAFTTDEISLKGKITDAETQELLIGVSIYCPDLKTGTITDANGAYELKNLPKRKIIVQVRMLGYQSHVEEIDLSQTSERNFSLFITAKEINEVVITGVAHSVEKNRAPMPISIVPHDYLLESTSSNIINAISAQPGISQVTTGSAISKPVIRGLGYNRVVVVNDGIRQEGQQWGDEHGIEIDEFSVNKVEILKGPASLSYGSDAMAGVIHFLSAPTVPEGKIRGDALFNYQTNNGLIGYTVNTEGNKKGLIWNLRYSNKKAHAYKNRADGYVFNSGFAENAASGIIGMNKSWGYSHIHLAIYELTPGIVEGDRDSATGNFIVPVAFNDTTEGEKVFASENFKSYDVAVPFQKINHYKIVLNNSFIIKKGTLKLIAGFQQNRRKEFADILNPDQFELYFLLKTFNYDFRYAFPEKNHFNLSIGINGMQQKSENKGIEFLVPEYKLFDAGIFAIFSKQKNKWDFSGGIRFDMRTQDAEELFLNDRGEKTDPSDPAAQKIFGSFSKDFSGISGSAGLTYQFSTVSYTKFNISAGYRAPNIAELGSNGIHEGTIRYEIGNAGLTAEHSLQGDLAYGINTSHVTAEINLFENYIQNFIFISKLNTSAGTDSIIDGSEVFMYKSGNANLFGGEFSIDIHPHPLDWLHFENAFSYVNAQQSGKSADEKYLPFTPSPKITTDIKIVFKKLNSVMKNSYIKAGIWNFLHQDKVYSAFDTETPTPGYTLINAGIGTDITMRKKKLFSILISVTNAGDIIYQNHLSRLKYAAENNVTGRKGVFNEGRSFSFKVIVPVE